MCCKALVHNITILLKLDDGHQRTTHCHANVVVIDTRRRPHAGFLGIILLWVYPVSWQVKFEHVFVQHGVLEG